MKKILLMIIMFLPGMVGAASDCRVVDFQDHFEAVCTGQEGSAPAPQQPAVAPQPTLAPEPPPQQVQAAPPAVPETERVTVQTNRSAGSYRQRKSSH